MLPVSYSCYYISVRKLSVKSSMLIHTFNPSPPVAMAVVLLWFKATLGYKGRTRPVTAIYVADGKKEEEKEGEGFYFTFLL